MAVVTLILTVRDLQNLIIQFLNFSKITKTMRRKQFGVNDNYIFVIQ